MAQYQSTPTPWAQADHNTLNFTPQTQLMIANATKASFAQKPNVVLKNQTQVATQVVTPTINLQQAQTYQPESLSISPVKINATGISGFDPVTAQEYLQRAQTLKKIGGYAAIGSFASSVYDAIQTNKQASQYTKDVKATIGQYETQKKLIDANIAKQEELMTEAYTENMAQADVMYAGKNVDISSEALIGVKQKAGIDLSEDIADIREQGELNKSALNLEYAMNVRKAAQEEKYAKQQAFSSITGAAFNTALTLALL